MRTFRHIVSALALLGAALSGRAQSLATLRETGPRTNRINFVFLAEGYTASEQAKFGIDAAAKLTALLADEAWVRFVDQINAYGIFVASAESGADDPSAGIVRNTYFNSSFGGSGLQRLLVIPPSAPGNSNPADGTGKVNALLVQFLPDYDVVILLVNSTMYGGSGGFPTITSLDDSSDEVVLHELGHSFANLTDEYVDPAAAPFFPPAERINATQKTIRGEIPWRAFIAPATPLPTPTSHPGNVVGLYEGAHYRATGFYRPMISSKMLALGQAWGPIHLRAFADGVHRLNLNLATAAPTITQQPASAAVASGQPHTLSAQANGAGPLTYQWRFNQIYVTGATASSYTIPSVDAATSGLYALEVTNAAGTTNSIEVTIGTGIAPSIATHPVAQFVTAGGGTTFAVTATGTDPLSYQWYRDGVAIVGATASTLTLPSAQRFHAGAYTVTVSNPVGSSTSTAGSLTVSAPAVTTARLLNLSTRGLAQAGDNVLIPGFVVSGSGTKKLLIRAVGPTLGKPPFNIGGVLPNPTMRLLRRNTATQLFEEIAANDNWGDNTNAAAITQTMADLFAFAFNDALEAALLMDLSPGEYTVNAGGVGNNTGIAIVELYDADLSTGSGQAPASRLVNISNRGFAGTGDQVMIPGFVVSSEGPKTLLVRVVGPTLGSFGVPGTMADPKLTVFAGQTPILDNDNWGDNPDAAYTATIAAQVFAFSLATGSKDAAFVVTLQPGNYTVVGSSAVAGGTGVVLVEVYVVP